MTKRRKFRRRPAIDGQFEMIEMMALFSEPADEADWDEALDPREISERFIAEEIEELRCIEAEPEGAATGSRPASSISAQALETRKAL